MRCLNLAEVLRRRGATSIFVCREQPGDKRGLLEERGFQVRHIATDRSGSPGFSEARDAAETRALIEMAGSTPDWVVVDHYGLGESWERAVRGGNSRILAIDDLANRPHDCDVLLDQNLVAGMSSRYEGRVPPACATLLGPEYALLDPVYSNYRQRVRVRKGKPKRVLIAFGVADHSNVTGRALSAVLDGRLPGTAVDVVVNRGNKYADEVRALGAGKEGVCIHSDLPNLAELILAADVAIGAGGVSSWERLSLGLPSLIVTIADNQRDTAESLDRLRLARWAGHFDEIVPQAFSDSVKELLQNELDPAWSLRCSETVDAKGATRVSDVLLANGTAKLRARPARAADETHLLLWVNDPDTRRSSFSPEPISAESHHVWFLDRLGKMQECPLYVIETSNETPIGQARLDRVEGGYRISYSLARAFRGRGLGRPLITVALSEFRQDHPDGELTAEVKADNLPSRRIFEALGFSVAESGGRLTYRRSAKTSNSQLPDK